MKTAAIVVAAGRSSRFEAGNKLLALHHGKPLVTYALDAAEKSSVDEIVLVTGPGGDAIVQLAGDGRWRCVVNHRAEDGLSSSIQAGLSALASDIDGTMILLADMPRVSPVIINSLHDTFIAGGGQRIVFPSLKDGTQGNPVLWPRALFAELMTLEGDVGGKAVLARHPELHTPVPIEDHGITFDIDTIDDLDR